MQVLGRRTGQLHLALAESCRDVAFTPVETTASDLRKRVCELQGLQSTCQRLLRARLRALPEAVRIEAAALLAQRSRIEAQIASLACVAITATQTRCHDRVRASSPAMARALPVRVRYPVRPNPLRD